VSGTKCKPQIFNLHLAKSVFFSIYPSAFEPVVIFVVVHAEPVLVVIGVVPDEDVTSLCRVVTASTVKVVFLECSFVKVSVVENLKKGRRR